MKNRKTWALLGILAAIALPITLAGRLYVQRQEQATVSAEAADAIQETLNQEFLNPEDPSLSADELNAIQNVIDEQMAAFKADDAEKAFSFASPGIRDRFQTADRFLNMVKTEYPSVYRPQSISFEAVEVFHGSPVQVVTLLGPEGQWMTAYYQMEQQADNTWRVAGCFLMPVEGDTI